MKCHCYAFTSALEILGSSVKLESYFDSLNAQGTVMNGVDPSDPQWLYCLNEK